MAHILDTVIEPSTDRELIRAFLYGQIQGGITFYTKDDGTLAIKFENEEDATFFKLKELDKVFEKEFGFGEPEPEPSLAKAPRRRRKKNPATVIQQIDDLEKAIKEAEANRYWTKEKKYEF